MKESKSRDELTKKKQFQSLEMMLSTISGYDYGVFALSLLVPVFVSLHCACVGTRKTPAAFLLADRKLRTVPIGFSVALAFVSSTLVTGASTGSCLSFLVSLFS